MGPRALKPSDESAPPVGVDIDPTKTVGGQAVLEGVMMRAPTAWAVAVRKPDKEIVARRDDLPRLSTRSRWAKVPLVRGILVLGESLSLGFRALSWSAQNASDEEEEPLTKFEIGWTMLVALVIFAGLFIVLPAAAAHLVAGESNLLFTTIEGVLRLAIFIGYIWVIGRSKEIGRVFEYHGAEHMSIYAFEAGEPLSIESVRRYPPEHPRCGTSFLMIVVLASIILFTFVGRPSWLFLVGSRLLGIPLIAGFAYELLRYSGTRGDTALARFLAAPGLWLQKLTTRVPDDDQIEVAISSLVVAVDDDTFGDLESRGGIPEAALHARASINQLSGDPSDG